MAAAAGILSTPIIKEIVVVSTTAKVAAVATVALISASASIGAAESCGVIKWNIQGATDPALVIYKNVGRSYINDSDKFPNIPPASGLSLDYPRGYEELNICGRWHNEIIKKSRREMPYTSWNGIKGPFYNEWWTGGYNKAFSACSSFWREAQTNYNVPNYQEFSKLTTHYKNMGYINDYLRSFLDQFIVSYMYARNQKEVQLVCNNYICWALSRRDSFTEQQYQAILVGMSVALDSPSYWQNCSYL